MVCSFISEKYNLNPNLGDIISIATNESRLKMLFELDGKKQTVSSLAKNLGLIIQDTHRNVNKMIDAGVLVKDGNGFLQLTTLGKFMVQLFPSFHFVVNNIPYFQDHSFDGLPEKFIQRIGALKDCKLTVGVVRVIEEWLEMLQQSQKFIKVIASQSPLESVEATLQKANQGLKINLILGKNTIFPERIPKLLKEYHVEKLEENGFFETKIIDEIDFCLVVTDKEASISFSRIGGEVDIDQTFFGKDPLFLDWCNELFENVWAKGNTSDVSLRKKFGIL
jgi:predicted transcriptional regulator